MTGNIPLYMIQPQSEGMVFGNQIALEWLTTEQAAFFLGISANALRIKVCRNQIRVHYFRRRLRFRIEELRQALKQKESDVCR